MYRKFFHLGKFFIPSPFESLLASSSIGFLVDRVFLGPLGGDRLLSVLLPIQPLNSLRILRIQVDGYARLLVKVRWGNGTERKTAGEYRSTFSAGLLELANPALLSKGMLYYFTSLSTCHRT
ncbi:hypothetical protein L1987_89345 [Smallanthus sonchifolius]|nr:hypothetical protein L1987_89345 [Smallanthus sonchifolius]